ncbi:hypothetical protein QBC35DRAFT_510809 [Podospora australis]|uniref:Zn(2)-C6 fungal-type domain-containing protein n=1 Tax=Podospora australis TaxID=1536484 RepID=A0AAN6WKU0_9PEZI|nr:hypothetical protein QBC35DRAFT_510809 [Podospora australis]
MPCTNCFRNGRSCVIDASSVRCKECIDRKVSCDGKDFAAALIRSIEETRRLAEEEEKLRAELLAVNSRLLSIASRKRATRERADELFRRGTLIMESDLSSFTGNPDDPPTVPTPVSSPPNLLHQFSLDVAADAAADAAAAYAWPVDPVSLVDPGSVGGTAGASQGNSGS